MGADKREKRDNRLGALQVDGKRARRLATRRVSQSAHERHQIRRQAAPSQAVSSK